MTEECVNEMWYIHTMEYSALKRKEILTYVTTWMKLEDITLIMHSAKWKTKTRGILLREISPSRKDKYRIIPLV